MATKRKTRIGEAVEGEAAPEVAVVIAGRDADGKARKVLVRPDGVVEIGQASTVELQGQILAELKTMNRYLAILTDEHFAEG